MKKGRSNSLVIQGSILAAASLIVRFIGFFYRVPLVRLLGDEGMGLYSSSFEIYSFLLIISSYAMPSALSKIISKQVTLGKHKEAYQVFKAALMLGLIMGLITSGILFFGAKGIASFVGSPGSVVAIRTLSPAMFIFSIMAVFRGYFQGHNTMIPTAISQIIEQVFNAIFSIGMAYLLLSQGLMYGAAGGTLGTGIGALFGLLFLVFIYVMSKERFERRREKDTTSNLEMNLFSSWQIIAMTSVPMIIGTTAYNLSNLVDMILFQRGLLYHGYEQELVSSMWGVFSSKYRLILTLPISIASAMATAAIPSITASIALKDPVTVKRKVYMALKTVFTTTIPASFGLLVLAKPILWMLFGSSNLDQAALLLQIGSITVVLFGVSAVCIGILQGLGLIKVPVRHSLVALAIKTLFMVVVLFIFDFGLYGAVAANILFAGLVAFSNYYRVHKEMHLHLNIKSMIGLPALSAGLMALFALAIYQGLFLMSASNGFSLMVTMVLSVGIYGVLLIKVGGITKEELEAFPMGGRLTDLLKKIRLIA